jgi:PadR family transcriptional regulator PadR
MLDHHQTLDEFHISFRQVAECARRLDTVSRIRFETVRKTTCETRQQAGSTVSALPLLTERNGRTLPLDTERKAPLSKPSDLVLGTLDLLLLKILALEPLHGWAIGQRLRSISGEVLQVSEGSLYPALHKLEQEGWITAEWKQTENNRRAKFYSLTRLGKRQLDVEAANWRRLSTAISHVVQLSEA